MGRFTHLLDGKAARGTPFIQLAGTASVGWELDILLRADSLVLAMMGSTHISVEWTVLKRALETGGFVPGEIRHLGFGECSISRSCLSCVAVIPAHARYCGACARPVGG